MADSVLLAGAAARIEFSAGSAGIDFGPITYVVCVKRAATGDWDTVLHAPTPFYRIGFSDANEVFCGDGTTENFGGPANTSLAWQIIGITKPAGTAQPQYHVFDGTSWSHPAPAGATIGDGSAASGHTFSESGGDVFAGNGLIFGIDDSEFSTGQIEALSNGYAAWIAAGFLEGVRLDAISGLSTFTGGSMSQGTTVGASLDTDDVPSWWNDSLGAPAVSPDNSQMPKYLLAGRSTV
jgi:hypothetical protein